MIENLGKNREITKKGRPKGLTLAEGIRRKEEYLKEKEKRLLDEGVSGASLG